MKTIFVNGCFDVIHPGHIQLFKYAKSLGDYLIVAIDSDKKVGEMKGYDRPIFCQEDRAKTLEAIRYIDIVYIFDSKKELEGLIKTINPDIMIVGSDWKGKEVVGKQYAKEVRFFDRVGEYSTTRTIQGLTYR
jgi:D-beta-D-heptose 7-phosphate kinase/D-beta-D-heptose 1-phosphate adenosyltransferase